MALAPDPFFSILSILHICYPTNKKILKICLYFHFFDKVILFPVFLILFIISTVPHLLDQNRHMTLYNIITSYHNV